MSYDRLARDSGIDPLIAAGINRGKRDYDVALILPNKTSANVLFEDPEEYSKKKLSEPSASDKSKMEQWKSRRTAYFKNMLNVDLNIFAFYSSNRENVIVKIGIGVDKLKEIAEQKRHLIQLKDEHLGAYAEYKRDYQDEEGKRNVFEHLYREGEDENPGPSAMFRTVDRIQLIDHCLRSHSKGCCGIDIGQAMTAGDIKAYFPLHENSDRQYLLHQNFFWAFLRANEIGKIRDYFGEKIGFYFLWMVMLTGYLTLLAAIGLVLFVIDSLESTPDNIFALPFAFFVCLWNATFVHLWRRESAHYSLQWGTLNLKEEFEDSRPAFHGEKRINPVTERVDYYYPWSKRIFHVMKSFSVIACAMVALVFVTLTLFTLRHTMHAMGHPAMPFVFMVINAIIVEVLNQMINSVAVYLTDCENHRTEREYETFLMAKTVIFKFFNSYISLYYIAFFKGVCLNNDCMVDLEAQLAVFVFFRLTIANAAEVCWPKMVQMWRQLRIQMGHLSFKERIEYMMSHSQADMSIAEMESSMNIYHSFDDLDEMIITYGYTVLFTVVAPWVPAIAIVANIIEIFIDSRKMLTDQQRPFPQRVRNQEPWDSVFDIISVIGIFTNLALVTFTSKELDNWAIQEKAIIFLVLEHLIFFARVFIKSLMPEIPTEITVLDLKHQHIVRKYLDGVEVEDHDLKSRTMTKAELHEDFCVYDHDEEEEAC